MSHWIDKHFKLHFLPHPSANIVLKALKVIKSIKK